MASKPPVTPVPKPIRLPVADDGGSVVLERRTQKVKLHFFLKLGVFRKEAKEFNSNNFWKTEQVYKVEDLMKDL